MRVSGLLVIVACFVAIGVGTWGLVYGEAPRNAEEQSAPAAPSKEETMRQLRELRERQEAEVRARITKVATFEVVCFGTCANEAPLDCALVQVHPTQNADE
jgi:hypothetical protein